MIRWILLWLLPIPVFSQALSEAQVKGVNQYTRLVNHLTEQVETLGPSLKAAYEQVVYKQKYPSRLLTPYTCRMDAGTYYPAEADKVTAVVNAVQPTVTGKLKAVRDAYDALDQACKELEIYYRLKDYERDQFEKFRQLINGLCQQVEVYQRAVAAYQQELNKLTPRLSAPGALQAYAQTDKVMQQQLAFEETLLNGWTMNLHEGVYTGWPVEATQKHILEDNARQASLTGLGQMLKYPASSMVRSFVEGIASLQRSKRLGVDGVTFESKQSDRYGNDVYDNLINYYNNDALSFYQNFIQQAAGDGYRGLLRTRYVSLFALRETPRVESDEVKPFVSKPLIPFQVTPVETPIPAALHTTLVHYVDFINDGVRVMNNLMNPMRNLNGSASHGVARLATGNRVTIDYYNKDVELPVTLYQQTISESKNIPPAYRQSLINQAETLYAILVETEQWNTWLLTRAARKELVNDSLRPVYRVFERFRQLSEAFNVQKEKLYQDVRSVSDAYRIARPASSWHLSAKGMLSLLAEDRTELFKAKQFLLGDRSLQPNTTIIDQRMRDLITNEYTNLKGIEKLGRYNGNCPYTPYEDLAQYSKLFGEFVIEAYGGKQDSYYKHPYNRLVHSYNESLVYAYNKFVELSKEPLLPMNTQVEIFEVQPPEKPAPVKKTESTVQPVEQPVVVAEEKPVVTSNTGEEKKNKKKAKNNNRDSQSEEPVTGRVVHDTVRITDVIRIETVRRDTVVVSRVDTVYVGLPEGELSMEGYATNNMVLLLDVSGSMNAPDKLPLLKKSVLLLLKMMRPEDEVSIVTYSGKAAVALSPTSFQDEEKIRKVIERLKSEGKTDGNAGLKLAYAVADKNYIRGGNNRIVLATDGEFPISKEVFDLVKKFSDEDIFISVFNFGKSTTSASNLQRLASTGKGSYEFITRENVDAKLIREVKAKRKK
jgi:Ca-activated chloride channel family protein